MARLSCNDPKCPGGKQPGLLQLEVAGRFGFKGILSCLGCGRERSIAMEILERSYLSEVACLVGEQSKELTSNVPKDIKEDIQEAERAHLAQCYRACVTMCRRALEFALIEKGIKEGVRLTDMLNEALKPERNLLTQDTYNLAITIKGYGCLKN